MMTPELLAAIRARDAEDYGDGEVGSWVWPPADRHALLAEIDRLQGNIFRLEGIVERLEVEKFALAEQLIQMGSDPS